MDMSSSFRMLSLDMMIIPSDLPMAVNWIWSSKPSLVVMRLFGHFCFQEDKHGWVLKTDQCIALPYEDDTIFPSNIPDNKLHYLDGLLLG